MEQFFQRLHNRRESLKKSEMAQSNHWKEDEHRVRSESCSFSIKYFGHTEVVDSKGSDLCEQSFYKLKYNEPGKTLASHFHRRRPSYTSIGQHSTLQISGEAIRIISDNEDVIAEVPVSNVSFCSPNNHHEHAFAFICRGDLPWKWHCHVMEAVFDQGERLNHAFGCAFTVCLEKKMLQKRRHSDAMFVAHDAPSVTVASGTFRQIPIAERLLGPEASIVAGGTDAHIRDPAPTGDSIVTTSYAPIDRPRAPQEFKERKGSLDGLIAEAYPFKRSSYDKVDKTKSFDEVFELIAE